MKIIENFLDANEVNQIKEHYKNHSFTCDIGDYANTEVDQELFNKILHEKFITLFDSYKITQASIYQRCYLPFGIHTDSKTRMDPTRSVDTEGVAVLIPLDEGEHFNTVVWKEKCANNEEITQLITDFVNLPNDKVQNSNITEEVDLDFAWEKGERNFCNHLTLDGVYNWKLGTAVIWERNQLHASSDFTKHHKYKDAITTFFE